MNMLRDAWEAYKEKVISKEAGFEQVFETRKAFYAGAGALFFGILNSLGQDEETTEQDMARMDAINKELNVFLEEMKPKNHA